MIRKKLYRLLLALALALAVAPSILHSGANGDLLRAVSLENIKDDDFSKRMIPELRRCLDAGADINARNELGRNAILILFDRHGGAPDGKFLEVLRFLVDRGADVNAADCYGVTPLMVQEARLREYGKCGNCEYRDRIDSIEAAIAMLRGAGARSAPPPATSWSDGEASPAPRLHDESDPDGMLVGAIERGDRAAAKDALDRGACAGCFYHRKAPVGNYYIYSTPLRRAAELGDVALAELLLRRGADPNDFDVNMLHRLGDERMCRIVRLHIDAGADFGGGVIFDRYTLPRVQEMRNYLFEKRPALKEEYELGSLLRKTFGGPGDHPPIKNADVLLKIGSDIEAWKNRVAPYAMRAARAGQWDLVERFIDAGIDPPYEPYGMYVAYLMGSKNPGRFDYFTRKGGSARYGRRVFWALLWNHCNDRTVKQADNELETVERLCALPIMGIDDIINSLERQHLGDIEYQEVSPLMMAAYYGKERLARLLIGKGADINRKNREGECALSFAVTGSREAMTRLLIDAGADIDSRNRHGATPLMAACYRGNAAMVKILIESGATVKAADASGWTPLVYASHSGNVELVRYLLDRGAEINTVSKDGVSPLVMARLEGNASIMKFLGEQGAVQDDTFEGNLGNQMLLLAAGTGRTELVEKLIGKGADVNCTDFKGGTPLFHAAMNGHLGAARALVKAGADAKKRCQDDSSPLHAAIAKTLRIPWSWDNVPGGLSDGRIGREMIELLIKAGADVNAVDAAGRTPLVKALSKYRASADTVKRLLRAGADPNRPSRNGMTPLMNVAGVAAMHFYEADSELDVIVNDLLQAGARPDAVTAGGVTALMLFTHADRKTAASVLLRAGADPNTKTKNGLAAVDFGKTPSMVRSLMSRGAAPTAGSQLLLGKAALKRRDYAAAKAHFSRGLEIAPGSGLGNYLGYTLLRMKEYGKAERALLKAFTLDRNSPHTCYNLACLYSVQGKKESALEWLGRSVEKGFREKTYLLYDRDLEGVRGSRKFRDILKTIE
jgi:ankyrin repeat protein